MSEIGIPLPPVEPTEPSPPITPEPPPVDGVVRPPVEPTPAPTPAPPIEPELPPSGGGGGGFPDLWDLAALLLVLGIVALLFYFTGLVNFILRVVWSSLGRGGSAPQLNQTQLGKPVSSILAPYVTSRDAQFGADFALMGATVARVGRAILAAEETLYHAVQTFLPLQGQVASTASKQAGLSNRISHAQAQQQAQARAAAQAQANAQARAHGISERLTALETHITTLIQPELEALQDQIPELRRGAAVTRDELRQHSEALGATGLALGVAGALGSLGAGYVRCENNGQLGRANCGLPSNLLKDLLAGLSVLGLGTFTLIALAEWGQTIIHLTDTAVEDFWAVSRRASPSNPRIGQAG